jgi:hypothetical protein
VHNLPTIEIVIHDNKEKINIETTTNNLAIRQDINLKSHRNKFQDYLNNQNGIILHLGNSDLNENTGFYGNELIDWDLCDYDKDLFRFNNDSKKDIELLLKEIQEKSISNKISFLTDIQSYKKRAKYRTLSNLNEFWKLHDSKGLTWNTLYTINN